MLEKDSARSSWEPIAFAMRENGVWCQHDDPVDKLDKNTVKLIEKTHDNAFVRFALLVDHFTKCNTKDNSIEDNCSKVSADEGCQDVIGDKLGEDTLIYSVAERDVILGTARFLDEGS
jgi:hypothetical protein